MRFGLRLIQYLGDSRRLVRLATLGEAAGFDSVWFPHDPFLRNAWVLTAATCQATTRIRVGAVGTTPFAADPSEIATYAATLAELSGGRAILGFGMHTEDMVGWTGTDGSDYLERTRDSVDLLRRLFRGEVAKNDGPRYNWNDQCVLKFGEGSFEVPIYVAAFGEEYLQLSGQIGDGSLPMLTPPESAGLMLAPILKGLAQSKRPRDSFTVSGCCWLSLDEERHTAAAILKRMITYFGPYLEDRALASIGIGTQDFAKIRALVAAGRESEADELVTEPMLRLGIVGTAHEVIERIEYLESVGVDEVNLGGPLGPDPERAIALMGEVVIPHFRAKR